MGQSSVRPIDQARVHALMLHMEQLTLSYPQLAVILAAIHQKLVASLTAGVPESLPVTRKLGSLLIGREISAGGFPCVSVRWPEKEREDPYVVALIQALEAQGLILNQLHVPRSIGILIALSAQD